MARIIALHRERMAQTVLDAVRTGDRRRLRRLLAPAVTLVDERDPAGVVRGSADVAAALERMLGAPGATVRRVGGRDGIVVAGAGGVITFDARWRIGAVRVIRDRAALRPWTGTR